MPPLWIILVAVAIVGLTLTIDRLILKPRNYIVVVDGKSIAIRRKRDVTILTAIEGALFAVALAGVLVITGGPLLLVLVSPFFAVTIWWFWSGIRMGESPPPTEEEVKRGKLLVRKAIGPPRGTRRPSAVRDCLSELWRGTWHRP